MLLTGTIDTHVHFAPHASCKANTNALDLANLARKAGMAGMLLKCNTFPSVGIAYLTKQLYPDLLLFGGIVLNHQCGGLNYSAVKSAISYGEGRESEYCRFVCLPTFAAENDITYHNRNIAPIKLVDTNNQVVDDLKRIFELIASSKQILFTGHIAEKELFPVVEKAKACGIEKIVVPHPLNPVVNISLTAQKQLAEDNVLLQHCCVETYPYFKQKYGVGLSIEQIAEAIEYVGTEHCILASDLGADPGVNPDPVKGFSVFLQQLKNYGFNEKELRRMSVENPLRIINC